MFVLETVTLRSGKTVPASLVYMADVDGPVDRHLRALVENAASGVDKLFGSCEGYPARADNAQRVAWLQGHTLKAAAYYVHTVGRTVERIKDETRLYDCVQDILDRGEVPVTDAAPTQLRRQLRDAVLRRADFLWIKEGLRGAGLVRELRDSVQLFGGLALLLAAAPILVPVAVLWLLLVRAVEQTDSQEEGVPDQKHVDEVRRYEDFGAQNPFTGVGEIKPGLVRLVTMRVALAGLGLACRLAYNRDTLAASTRSISPAGYCSMTTLNNATSEAFVHPGTRSPVPAAVCHQGPGPRRRDRLVPRFLQPTAPTHFGRLAATRRVREDRGHPTGSRIPEAA